MDYSKALCDLREFVQEVREYNGRQSQSMGNAIVVSQAMMAFVLPDLSKEQLFALVEQLQSRGYIQYANGESLTFSTAFLEPGATSRRVA